MQSPVRIVVVGVGLIGKRHCKHVVEEHDTCLIAIVEPASFGQDLAQQYNVPCFATLPEVLASGIEFEAAIIATPTGLHVEDAILVLNAGKYALVEKPISGDVESARRLIEADQRAGGKILMGHNRRFNPYIVALKKAVDSGVFGTLLGISGIWTTRKPLEYYVDWRKSGSSGGTIAINLIHDLDLFRFLFGEIQQIYCEEGQRTRGFTVEETGAMTFRFCSGAVGTFFFSDAAASPFSFEGATGENPDLIGNYGKNVYTIFGTRSTMQLPDLLRYSWDHLADKDRCWLKPLQATTEFEAEDVSIPPFTLQLQHFVRLCRGEEKPRCSSGDGLKAIMAAAALKESLKKGRPVALGDLV